MKICFDLDGTLLNDRGLLSIETVNDIRKLFDDGYEIIIATARPFFGLKHLMQNFNFIDTFITSQGATIYKRIKKNEYTLVSNETINSQTLMKVFNIFNPEIKELWLFYHDCWYTTNKTLLSTKEANYLCQLPKIFLSSLHLKSEPTKIVVPSPSRSSLLDLKILEFCNSETSNNELYLEITKLGVNKAKWLKSNLDNISETLIVVGDSDNDVCLFEIAKTSISVSNSSKEIKANTDFSFERSPQKGIINLRRQFRDINV